MNQRRLSYRALAELTRTADPSGRGVSYAYLCALVAGREYPSRRAMQLIARSLDIDPDRFAEHRIATLRDQLNGREVGFQAAWRRYLELVD
jgi:transcriptional regulator with XRE-family HTH domain